MSAAHGVSAAHGGHPRAGAGGVRAGAGGARAQVRRLLALLPYLLANQGARLADVAAVFGVTEKQLRDDLHVLWFCGLPGLLPGDMVEVDMAAVEGEGTVHVANADFLSRPMRFTGQELLALLVALEALRDVAAPERQAVIDRLAARLTEVAGRAAPAAGQVEVRVGVDADPAVRTAVERALQQHVQLRIRYLVPFRDEATDRVVDPIETATVDGHAYLQAWCHRAQDVRLFRLDRVTAAELLDTPASPPPRARPRDLSAGLFQPSPDDLLATLELAPPAAWVAEYFPCEEVRSLPGGRLRVRLRVGDDRWLCQLVLRLGGAARIVDPADLAARVAAAAGDALAAYDPVG